MSEGAGIDVQSVHEHFAKKTNGHTRILHSKEDRSAEENILCALIKI